MRLFPRKIGRWAIVFVIVVILIASLSAWTILSAQILVVQNSSEISASLFQFADSKELVNMSDAEGSYTFLFGMNYNESVSPGVPTIIEVFALLAGQTITSGFMKGVALQFTHASILFDGVEDSGTKSQSTTNGNLVVDRISQVEINDTSGTHLLSVHLIVSTVDVNYIGYFPGTEQVISLNGSIMIS